MSIAAKSRKKRVDNTKSCTRPSLWVWPHIPDFQTPQPFPASHPVAATVGLQSLHRPPIASQSNQP
eukprot:3660964-Amphidinium_carterae.1